MQDLPSSTDLPNTHPQLLDALASLNEIGTTINQLTPGDTTGIEETLYLIVESAIKVIPDTSAVIYIYDLAYHRFDPNSRLSAGEKVPPVPWDRPRPEGMGNRAINNRQRVLSYDEGAPEIHPVKADAGAQAVVCFPLFVAEEPVGALYIYLHEDRTFSELELLLLENFVNHTAMAIYHARQTASIQRDLTRKEDEIEKLSKAGLLIATRPRLKETLETILQMALEVTGGQYGNVWLMSEDEQSLYLGALAGDHRYPFSENFSMSQTAITVWVVKNRQAVCISDLSKPPWSEIYFPFDGEMEMRSELAVPLISANGRVEGVLNLESPRINAFSEHDSRLLMALATQAVITIQEVRLLDALKDVTERLLTQPPQAVLDHLVELGANLLNAAASAIWAVERDELVLLAANAGHEHDERIPLQDSLIGQAVLSGEPVLSDNVRTDPRFYRVDLAESQGWTRALVVPLSVSEEQEPVGAFSVYSVESEPGRFAESDWDKKILTILADYAALTVLDATRKEALKSVQEQRNVAETFAALGDIAANLLHQLNNKIGTIPVRIQGLQDKSAAALEADSYLAAHLAEIERSAREAMGVVRESLSILNPITPVSVNLAACVAEAITAASLPPEVQVDIHDLESLPPVIAGQHSLMLVFSNLLENAASAMGGQGQVSIRGRQRGKWVEIAVSDTGPGIATDLHGRIFEFNFSAPVSEHAGKLGFGLWWIKTLMTRLGGTVMVESDGQHGTTFRLKLPCDEQKVEDG